MEEIKIFQKFNPDEEKILRKKSKKVSIEEIKSEEIGNIIKKMWDFLLVQPDGAALAAPQIGHNLRIFIVNPNIFEAVDRRVPPIEDLVFINPEIIKKSKKKEFMNEGCFSVRWFYGEVERHKNVTIEALNQNGEKKKWEAGGLLAQVFQHEIDHLDGILFSDKAKNIEKISDEEKEKLEKEKEELIKKIKK